MRAFKKARSEKACEVCGLVIPIDTEYVHHQHTISQRTVARALHITCDYLAGLSVNHHPSAAARFDRDCVLRWCAANGALRLLEVPPPIILLDSKSVPEVLAFWKQQIKSFSLD